MVLPTLVQTVLVRYIFYIGSHSLTRRDSCCSVENSNINVVFGLQERSKALGYLNARDYKALEKTGDELPSDVNELFITITRCSDLNARREGIYNILNL